MASCARSRFLFSVVFGARATSTSATVGGNTRTFAVGERGVKLRQLRKEKYELFRQNRSNPDMERAARKGTLLVPLEKVHEEESFYHVTSQLQNAASHFDLYQDMYGSVFTPCSSVRVAYSTGVVHHGNIITPTQAADAPEVGLPSSSSSFSSSPIRDDDLWTLVLSNPDGHWTNNSMELCHWMVCDIPVQGPISAGREVLPYCPPLPLRGTGVHRMVFSLYLHPHSLTIPASSHTSWLEQRTFNTSQFLSSSPLLRPFSLCFFQTLWDTSVQHMFSDKLCCPEPEFGIEKSTPLRKLKRERVRAIRANRYRFINPSQLRAARQQ